GLPARIEPAAQHRRLAGLGPGPCLFPVPDPRPWPDPLVHPQKRVEAHDPSPGRHAALGKISSRGVRQRLRQRLPVTLQISTGASRFFTFAGGSASRTNFSLPAFAAHSSEMTIMSSRATPQRREARFTPSPMAVYDSARLLPMLPTTTWPVWRPMPILIGTLPAATRSSFHSFRRACIFTAA